MLFRSVKDSVRTSVFIFPNPNAGHFTVRLPEGTLRGNYVVSIWDSKGALVYKGVSLFENQQAVFTLSQLSAGAYFIRVSQQNGEEIKAGKFIIGNH